MFYQKSLKSYLLLRSSELKLINKLAIKSIIGKYKCRLKLDWTKSFKQLSFLNFIKKILLI